MMPFKTLTYEKQDGIAHVTLNRPKALNAFNVQMRDDLYSVLQAIRDDDEIKVAVLKGAGEKAFCAGADLSEFLTAPPPVQSRKVRFERDIWGLFLSMPQPFIAALHGYVLGSGIEMALCCDIRIAAENAQFGLPEVALGIIPAAGGTQTLPRIVGRAKALEMLLTNRWIDANEARAAQLVNQVVPKDSLYEHVHQLTERIAGYNSAAVKSAKQAVINGLDCTLQEGLRLETLRSLRLKAAIKARE